MNIATETNEQRRTNFAALRWDAAWIDPAVRRLAEAAARQSDLTIEAWMERAIRKTCGMPQALHLARATGEQPAAQPAKGFSVVMNGVRGAKNGAATAAATTAQPQTEPRLFPEGELDPLPLLERIDDLPPGELRRSRAAPAESRRNRAISMIGAAGVAAILAIVAVALIREGGPAATHQTANSGERTRQTVSTLPPVSALDGAPLRVSANSTDHNVTFAAVPPPPIATAPHDAAADRAEPDNVLVDTVPAKTDAVAEGPASPAAKAEPIQMAALPSQTGTATSTQGDEQHKQTVTSARTPTPAAAPSSGPLSAAAVAPPKPAAPAPATVAASPAPATAPVAQPTQVAMAPTTAATPAAAPAPAALTPSDIKVAAALVPQVKAGDHLAEYRLGILYALGKGVPRDYNEAATLLHRAAQSGLPEAEYDYGVLCDKGLGVPRDSAEAARWYSQAAQQGHSPAALNLGYAYAEGLGVTRNLPEAAHWFRRAAEAGLVNAQFNLAYMFEQGAGMAKSQADAFAWYSVAAEKGDQGSQEAMERIQAKMSVRELASAKTKVKAIKRTIRIQH